jgi:hypothetical protein
MRRLAATSAALLVCLALTASAEAKSPRQKQMVDRYADIQAALADDSGAGVAAAAAQIAGDSRGAATEGVNTDVAASLARAAMAIQSDDVEQARAAFEPLTKAMYSFLIASDQADELQLYTCAEDHHHWLQRKGGKGKNPYRGPKKPDCAEPTDSLDH